MVAALKRNLGSGQQLYHEPEKVVKRTIFVGNIQ